MIVNVCLAHAPFFERVVALGILDTGRASDIVRVELFSSFIEHNHTRMYAETLSVMTTNRMLGLARNKCAKVSRDTQCKQRIEIGTYSWWQVQHLVDAPPQERAVYF